jgi:hypothetical protein
MNHRTRKAAIGAGLLFALLALGCASFSPRPMEEILFMERAQTQEREGLRITVAVLDRGEAKRAFGVNLSKKQIQPVWLEIENKTEIPYVLMLTGLDPAYFSAREAAYKSHFRLRPITNGKMDDHFDGFGIDPFVPPLESTSGFVFSNLKLGTKEVRVKLYGPRRVHIFEFYVPVPGFRADWHEVDWEALYAQETLAFQDEDALRQALKELPCCTTRRNGTGEGDPLNLVLIGNRDEIGNALIRAGWDETETLTAGSAWRTFRAFFGGTYKYSPMSALYVYGRPQDAGYQKARNTIHERNHLRLWLSPKRFRGKEVWIGTITRDIGVYFTTRAWNLTTHAIDPDVDEARSYLREDFQIAQSIERWGFVEGVGAATSEEPHRNLMNAPWWSDGLRLVLDVPDKKAVPLEEQRFFYWDWPDEDAEAFNEQLRRLAE